MAVAAAQRALSDSGLETGASPTISPERFGCVFGSDYMLTMPEDFRQQLNVVVDRMGSLILNSGVPRVFLR